MTQPVDSSILHEIVRIVESRRKVPEKVIVKSKEYLLTYLEDHQRRLEEALNRYDRDRLNMLYGQLASKIKYQLLRRIPARAAATLGAGAAAKPRKKAGAKAAGPAARVAAKKATAAKAAAKKPAKPVAKKKAVAAKRSGRTTARTASAARIRKKPSANRRS